MDIGSLFEQTVERYPQHTALVYEDRRWTYSEWHQRVRRFAQALADLGVRTGDRVAFYVSTSENSVTSYFALQLLGAVAVPVKLPPLGGGSGPGNSTPRGAAPFFLGPPPAGHPP